LLPESLPLEQRHAFRLKLILANYWKVGGHFGFVCKCLANALTFAGVAIYIGMAPTFLLDLLHLNVKSFAWLFVPLISGMTLGSWLAAKAAHRMSPSSMVRQRSLQLAPAAHVALGDAGTLHLRRRDDLCQFDHDHSDPDHVPDDARTGLLAAFVWLHGRFLTDCRCGVSPLVRSGARERQCLADVGRDFRCDAAKPAFLETGWWHE
jgi:hypothetical protein